MGIKRFTIDEFRVRYPDNDACLDKIFELRFKGLVCPKCESDNKFVRVKGRRSYCCPNCAFQVYPTKDTVFEKTTTPLTFWFYAIFLQTTTRNGVAAKELERLMPISYPTALRMNHQIKILIGNKKLGDLSEIVQIDETWVGQRAENMHAKKRKALKENGTMLENKVGVMGFVTSDKKVKFEVMNDTKTYKDRVISNVHKSAIIVTDSHNGYKGLDINFIKHEVINHLVNEFKRGDYTTNNIENAWSVLKRTIKGTHIHVSAKHLQKYVDEVAFMGV